MQKPSFALILSCLLVFAVARADTLPITFFGGKPDGVTDNGPAFRKAFAYAATHPGTTLQLGGICRITTPQATSGREVLADDKPAQTAALGEGIAQLTIEDGEVDLGGEFGAFSFVKCPGVTLRNVIFDYVPPILSQGSIVATDRAARSMTVVPDAGYPPPDQPHFPVPDHTWLTVHKPDGEPAYFFVGFINSATSDSDGKTTLRYDRQDMANVIDGQTDLRYVRVMRGCGHLLIFEFCDGVRLENCSIYATSAFASLFEFCNDVKLTGNKICPRPGSGRIVSTCADGFHFIGARRGPDIENNFFDRMQDDNIVISLRGSRIASAQGNQLQLAGSSATWYEAGDTLEVVTLDDGQHRQYKIVNMAPQKGTSRPSVMTLDRPLEGKIVPLDQGSDTNLPTLVFNRSWRLEGTEIRHNTFQNTRRYAVFMGAGGVRIEDNTMSNFSGAALLLSHYDMLKGGPSRVYYPYYFSSDVTVQRNAISGAFNYGEGGRKFTAANIGAIDIYDVDRTDHGIGNLQLAHDLVIRDNTIKDSGGVGIHVANASHVTVSGNTIVDPDQLNSIHPYGIWIQASFDPEVKDNQVEGSAVTEPVHVDP